MKKERLILFSTPMVQAILEGRKTQTRRTTGFKEVNDNPNINDYTGTLISAPQIHEFTRISVGARLHTTHVICPYGQPGDLLWVRETFAPIEHPELKYRFKADHLNPKSVIWKPSIHMPKHAARIWLKVKDVRVERVQNISEEDILKEGIRIPFNRETGNVVLRLGEENSALSFLPEKSINTKYTQSQLLFAHWAELWCKVNGRKSWDANPWVWVVEFEVVSTTGKHETSKEISNKQ